MKNKVMSVRYARGRPRCADDDVRIRGTHRQERKGKDGNGKAQGL